VCHPKKQKYSIAKEIWNTIEELEQHNPDIVSNLPIGPHLLIKDNPQREGQ
jgi:hypothetical protein